MHGDLWGVREGDLLVVDGMGPLGFERAVVRVGRVTATTLDAGKMKFWKSTGKPLRSPAYSTVRARPASGPEEVRQIHREVRIRDLRRRLVRHDWWGESPENVEKVAEIVLGGPTS